MRSRTPKFLILALDIGSSSARVALFDHAARRIVSTTSKRTYSIRYDSNSGAELNAKKLCDAVRFSLRKTLRLRRDSSLKQIPITATCGSGFWHGLLGLDRKGNPITPIWMWADSRSIRDAEILRRELSELKIQQRTGCMLRPSFWPAKLRWLQRTQRSLFRRVARFVSPADWIFETLFGIATTSHSMASATGIYNLKRRSWDRELCEFCGVDEGRLPKIFDGGPEIFSPIGDGAASNLGSGAEARGIVAINLGTSAAVRTVETCEQKLPFGLFRFVVDESRTLLGGAISNAGNLRSWCARELKIGQQQKLSGENAAKDSLTVLPFWVNERAPTWPDGMPGAIIGLSQTTTASEIFRATTTSVFYRLADILERLETTAGRSREIIVSGGMSRSRQEVQLLADSLGRDLRVASEPEASLRGAAVYALRRLGYQAARISAGKQIKHSRSLAAQHRIRRARQARLEDCVRDLDED